MSDQDKSERERQYDSDEARVATTVAKATFEAFHTALLDDLGIDMAITEVPAVEGGDRWDALPEEVQRAWMASAAAAVTTFLDCYQELMPAAITYRSGLDKGVKA